MERCVEHEKATLAKNVRRVEAEFVPPEGMDAAEAARLRKETGKRALFDPSKEACLARKYETSAECGFFRALKELRLVEKQSKVAEDEMIAEELGSSLPGEMTDREFEALYEEEISTGRLKSANSVNPIKDSDLGGRVDLPFTVGRVC